MDALAEQPPDRGLRPAVLALAEVHAPDPSRPVDQVLRRPVLVGVCVPGAVGVVERDRVAHAEAANGIPDVPQHALERELGRVHADDDEAVPPVRLVPRLEVRQRPEAVDAGVRPEVDEDDLAVELRERERPAIPRVQPEGDVPELRARASRLAVPACTPESFRSSRRATELRSILSWSDCV